jgi:NAD(P)-dependent dehydrogenase (short-subunit alcohol dehydrogenase family)
MPPDSLAKYTSAADKTAEQQRRLQEAVAEKPAPAPSDVEKPVQAGESAQPENPFPAQHLAKPGSEAELNPLPRFEAPSYKGSGKLAGKVALITGGDSGIGRAVAVLFAREGADVAILYLNEHEDAAATQKAVEAEGGKCRCIAGDVRDSRFCTDAVEAVARDFGQLDILVNNAAFQLHTDAIADLTDEHFDMTIRTNLYGYFHMIRAAVKHLPRGGCIINTGSETGLFGSQSLVDYSSTKGAIHALSKSLSTQLAPQGIRVNTVAPGPVWTPLNPSDRPAEKVPSFGSTTTMKRPAQPEEIAPAYVFLAAPSCSSYITGIELPIMGGVHGSG